MNKQTQFRKRNSNSLLGLIIILFGILLLIDQLIPGIYFFNRLFSWPMIIIVVGLIIGHKSRYENPSSYILIGIGTFFLVLNIFHISFNNLFWPVILIAIGFYLITSVSKKNRLKIQPSTSKEPLWDKRVNDEKVSPSTDVNNNRTMKFTDFTEFEEEKQTTNGNKENSSNQNYAEADVNQKESNSEWADRQENYIDSTSVFSSNKINVVSRRFNGGNIVNIFGGTEINLMHADVVEPASLEVVQLFGGSTIIAPAHWVIQPEMASFFGGIEDKRFTNSMPDTSKVLYIRGTSLFGGITIKSM